jgi:hypothetical protein
MGCDLEAGGERRVLRLDGRRCRAALAISMAISSAAGPISILSAKSSVGMAGVPPAGAVGPRTTAPKLPRKGIFVNIHVPANMLMLLTFF